MSVANIVFSPITNAIPAQGGALDLIVQIQGCDAPVTAESSPSLPKRLALVVDRSGSMAGEPLTEALRCVEHIAQHLGPQDQLAVLTYDTKVTVVQPLATVNPDLLKVSLMQVRDGGGTDLFAGWQAGARALADSPTDAISRVMLLSDGCANRGITRAEDILPKVSAAADQGVTTTTVGLGKHFNEDLMTAMARAGRGQQYFGQCAADLYDSFDEELQLLQALCLRSLTLELIPAAGVMLQLLGVVDTLPDGRIQLPDLPWAAEVWVAVRLHVSAVEQVATRPLLAASLSARSLDGKPFSLHAAPLQLPVVGADDMASQTPDPQVLTRLAEARFASDSQLMAQLIADSQLKKARALLQDMTERLGHHPWLQAKLDRLKVLSEQDRDLYRKEAHFSSRRTGQRLSARDDAAFTGDETHSDMPAFLRKKVEEGRGRRS